MGRLRLLANVCFPPIRLLTATVILVAVGAGIGTPRTLKAAGPVARTQDRSLASKRRNSWHARLVLIPKDTSLPSSNRERRRTRAGSRTHTIRLAVWLSSSRTPECDEMWLRAMSASDPLRTFAGQLVSVCAAPASTYCNHSGGRRMFSAHSAPRPLRHATGFPNLDWGDGGVVWSRGWRRTSRLCSCV